MCTLSSITTRSGLTRGVRLARLRIGRRGHRVVAPRAGVVVSVGVEPGRPSYPVLFRIRVS